MCVAATVMSFGEMLSVNLFRMCWNHNTNWEITVHHLPLFLRQRVNTWNNTQTKPKRFVPSRHSDRNSFLPLSHKFDSLILLFVFPQKGKRESAGICNKTEGLRILLPPIVSQIFSHSLFSLFFFLLPLSTSLRCSHATRRNHKPQVWVCSPLLRD